MSSWSENNERNGSASLEDDNGAAGAKAQISKTAICEVSEPEPFDRTKAIRMVNSLPIDGPETGEALVSEITVSLTEQLQKVLAGKITGGLMQQMEKAVNEVLDLLKVPNSPHLAPFLAIQGEDILLSKVPELPIVIQDYTRRNIRFNHSSIPYGDGIELAADALQGEALSHEWRRPTYKEAELMRQHHFRPSYIDSEGSEYWVAGVEISDPEGGYIQEANPAYLYFGTGEVLSYSDWDIDGLVAEVLIDDIDPDVSRLQILLDHQWAPEGMTNPEAFRTLAALLERKLIALEVNDGQAKIHPTGKLLSGTTGNASNGSADAALSRFVSPGRQINPEYDRRLLTEDEARAALDRILDRDRRRADITAYSPTQLEDQRQGSWELWDELEFGSETRAGLPFPVYARDPRLDVADGSVVGIDFGTSSTVVTYLDKRDRIHPMRIGSGHLAGVPSSSDYENPTVMQFIDIARFMEAYSNGRGRPMTSWEDLTVSKTAQNAWDESSRSAAFSSFFNELKQWAGSPGREARIMDMNGRQLTLPPYTELQDTDIDPIELYAYYIGLYVNNMHTGRIHMEYLLSFPATFPQEIRRRILDSFSRGIRRSLPQTVLSDSEFMANFIVEQGIVEPAAYAACALQEYGIDPKEGEYAAYGVFDFGGGTTDFDFGTWRRARRDKESRERNYNWVIRRFGGGGDPYLGGEHLLETLAFETFRANRDALLEARIPFAMPPHCRPFPGSEVLVQDSQEAHSNLRRLAKVLRPVWETCEGKGSPPDAKTTSNDAKENTQAAAWGITKIDSASSAGLLTLASKSGSSSYLDVIASVVQSMARSGNGVHAESQQNEAAADAAKPEPARQETIRKLQLFGADSHLVEGFEIQVDEEYLRDLIRQRIEQGVEQFFDAMLNAFGGDNLQEPAGTAMSDTIHIFLGGNASKSPVVIDAFRERTERYTAKVRSLLKDKGLKTDDIRLELHYPLGTTESDEQIRAAGREIHPDDLERPTAKTGVAFGILQCREGSKIKVISETDEAVEVPFQYWVGDDDAGAFRVALSPAHPYGQWVEFMDAESTRFEVRFTSSASAGQGMEASSTERVRRQIPRNTIRKGWTIYLRPAGPNEVEYVVAENMEAVRNREYKSEIQRFALSEE